MADTRKGFLLDSVANTRLERSDLTWSRRPVDPFAFMGSAPVRGQYLASTLQELTNALAWGCLDRSSPVPTALMLCVVKADDCVAGPRVVHGAAVLLANGVIHV